jgi:hypothetical protein
MLVYYGFGDTSGPGFGATIQIAGEIWYEYGQWALAITKEKSSNWREFTNLVEFIDRAVTKHDLDESEIFLFTDNMTIESAFWKGSSSSPLLFDIVLRLRQLEMRHNITLHVVHVSGRWMIAQGTDGLSRADHSTGVMQGRDIRGWIPLHLSALDRESRLAPWLWQSTKGLTFDTVNA